MWGGAGMAAADAAVVAPLVAARRAAHDLVGRARSALWEEAAAARHALEQNSGHVAAGTTARTLAQLFVHPVDTVKTRLQVTKPPKKLRKWRKKVRKNKHALVKLGGDVKLRNWVFKGPADIYRGITAAFFGTIPTAFAYFATYEVVKAALERDAAEGKGAPRSPAAVHLSSAAAGAMVSAVARVPADTVKHQVQAYLHKDTGQALRALVQGGGGLGAVYKGLGPTLMRDVPEIAIQFACYERLRALVGSRGGQSTKLATWQHLALGGASGAVAAFATMPLDSLKTRMQCGSGGNVPQLLVSVWREEGVRGLYAGLPARMLHVTVMSAVFFSLFEYCKAVIKPDRSGSDAMLLPKIVRKKRDKVWKRQFVME